MPIEKVGVLGAGLMDSAIALVFAQIWPAAISSSGPNHPDRITRTEPPGPNHPDRTTRAGRDR